MNMRRRELLGAIGILGTGAILSGVAGPLAGLLKTVDYPVASEVRSVMGSLLQINIARRNRESLELLDMAFAEAMRLEALLTRHKPGAPLHGLNATGHIATPPAELQQVLAAAIRHCRESGGFFDPTVVSTQPAAIDGVNLGEDGISLARSGTSITLDGIAKGYVVDRLSQLLHAHGAGNHLINAGGDIIACGGGPSGFGWKIGLQDPRRQGRLLTSFFLQDGAVATSGNYESLSPLGRGRAHILSPATAEAAAGTLSASAFAPSAMEADAMSTALFVMPSDYRRDYMRMKNNAACYVVSKSGNHEKIGKLALL